jgi:methyl-accepting chemotaxis protein
MIASTVMQQATATTEIAQHVSNAASNTKTVSLNIAAISDSTDHARIAASEVLAAAQALTAGSAELRGEVDGFLSSVRVA